MNEARESQKSFSRDKGQTFLIFIVIAAIVCSVIMLLTNSEIWMKISVVIALWGALLGLFLATQSRRDRDMFRSINAAQAAELELAYSRQDIEDYQLRTLEELKTELSALKTNIEKLSGKDLSYEPAAVQANARRLEALTTRIQETSREAIVDPIAAEGPENLDAAVAANRKVEENTHAGKPVETPRKKPETKNNQGEEKVASGREGFNSTSFHRVDWMTGENTGVQKAIQDTDKKEISSAGGRRRREDNAGSVSLEELLKNLKKK